MYLYLMLAGHHGQYQVKRYIEPPFSKQVVVGWFILDFIAGSCQPIRCTLLSKIATSSKKVQRLQLPGTIKVPDLSINFI